MNDAQRTRVILLSMCGILLIGAVLLVVNTQRQPAEDVAYQQQIESLSKANKLKKTPMSTVHAIKSAAILAKTNSASKKPAPNFATVSEAPLPPQSKAAQSTSPMLPLPAVPTGDGNVVATSPRSIKARLFGESTPLREPKSASAAGGPSVAPVLPLPPPVAKTLSATTMPEAKADAQKDAGRPDPFKIVYGYKSFLQSADSEDEDNKSESMSQRMKDKIAKAAAKHNKELVPPPPPAGASLAGAEGGGGGIGLPIDELPAPPTRPAISDKMKLIAVIGDRAIFGFTDRKAQQDNKWPKTITLGPGEKFESVSLVNVGDGNVTLDEDGDRSVKALDPIK